MVVRIVDRAINDCTHPSSNNTTFMLCAEEYGPRATDAVVTSVTMTFLNTSTRLLAFDLLKDSLSLFPV